MSKKKQNQKSTSPKKAQQQARAASSRSGQQTATKRARATSAATGSPAAVVHDDPRLPKAGTIIRKLDRDGRIRCKCRIVQQGVRYNGSLYRSLSGAAAAAATDLGLDSHQNGFVFWGLVN